MFCAISGKPPKVPVLSPNSKYVFEKELIEQYIQEEGKDPITGSPLAIDQLIEISQTPQQSALTNTLNSSTLNSNYSIPNLLSTLQNEWDAVMLENFKLRKQLDACTKQLSTAFYERDAAKVVAIKALKARAQIVEEMNQLTSQLGSIEESENVITPLPLNGLPDNLSEKLLEDSRIYLEQTKKCTEKFALPIAQTLQLKDSWDVSESLSIHTTTKLLEKSSRKIVFKTGDNGTICVLDGSHSIRSIQTELKDDVNFLSIDANEEYIFFSTVEGRVGVYDLNQNSISTLNSGTDEIIFMNMHEFVLNGYFLWADQKGKVVYSSLDCTETYLIFEGGPENNFFQAVLHKDGLLLALVQKDAVKIYNLSEPSAEPTIFSVGEEIAMSDSIKRVEFSSNGYWMVVSCGDSIMAFDLRKPLGTLAVSALPLVSRDSTNCWDMDLSGKHLMLLMKNDDNIDETKLTLFSYKKAKKIWEPIPDKGNGITLQGLQNVDVKTLHLLYDSSGLSVVLQTGAQIMLYTAT